MDHGVTAVASSPNRHLLNVIDFAACGLGDDGLRLLVNIDVRASDVFAENTEEEHL